MQKEIAIELLQEWRKLLDDINVVMESVERIEPESERLNMRRHAASLVVACEEHLLTPILEQYPDLDPL